jgi:hypothetical protein
MPMRAEILTKNKSSTYRRVALLTVALAVLVEISLRIGLGLGNPILIAPDPDCAYIIKPDQNVFRFGVHTSINHLGMRSGPFSATRTGDALRVFFLGDSITYGTTRVDQNALFTEILHRELPIEVLNASASAWAIDNELAYVQSRGIFNSDVVLLVLNSGDLTQSVASMASVGDALPSIKPLSAIGELYTRAVKPRLLRLEPRVDAGVIARENAGDVIRHNLASLDKLRSIVNIQRAHLGIIYLPFRGDIPIVSGKSLAVLSAWVASRAIPFLDLTAAEARYSVREVTIDNGTHLNAKGHFIVARELLAHWESLTHQLIPTNVQPVN